ncbi:CCA tRNA nucleotidyltransferase [uncultured Muribaculum sp.]|uniref:CCA tRNA nucleotidyltransferase n=1 Tax=uncultured Muribaculum sp. TaxID=1918613 RepID=UPI0026E36812|nr:HD domain-containing protein [uncultured Muribaculum sp.]
MTPSQKIDTPLFHSVGSIADSMNRQCYVVGGYVRDLFLCRHSKDIDFVTVGSGIEVAEAVAKHLGRGARCNVFKNFGTAQVKFRDTELEFVGARRESYSHDSRKPVVEDGTLDDDLSRRDFTINAMAMSVNRDNFGELIDPYDGVGDLDRQLIRTPLDPDITFSDDPLRMMRAIRFATQLQFDIHPETFAAIRRNASRIEIITAERIKDELYKIMGASRPSIGWRLLLDSGLLAIILPELARMKGIDVVDGRGHKDNFNHTMLVLDAVAAASDKVLLRWAALFHDIGKPVTKHYDPARGWTFHNHNFVGAKMVKNIFRRMKFPLGADLAYVSKLVELHMRPIALVEDEVTDSAVRRLANYAEEDLGDLMILARADITSRDEARKARYLANFDLVEEKFRATHEKDVERNRKNPVDGLEIMELFGLPQSPEVGYFAKNLKQAVKDCVIEDTREAAFAYLLKLAEEKGLRPLFDPFERERQRAAETDEKDTPLND